MESCSSETLSAFSEWIWKLNMNTCISRYSCSIVTSEDLCPGFDWTDPVTVQDCKTSTWLWASFLYTKNVTLCNWVDFFFFFSGWKSFFFHPWMSLESFVSNIKRLCYLYWWTRRQLSPDCAVPVPGLVFQLIVCLALLFWFTLSAVTGLFSLVRAAVSSENKSNRIADRHS